MAGIYFHIPFCRQACHYCNFHFSTVLSYKEKLVSAIAKELFLRKDELLGQTIETIYFGGGTPSLLNEKEWHHMIDALHKNFDLSHVKEFTVEANPDDLTSQYLQMLQQLGVNRLSIGVQSFNDEHLKWMNRAHNASEALHCIQHAQNIGLSNISIDLIYGIPGMDDITWKRNLQQAFDLNISHLSSYCLTIEPQTVFGHRMQKNTLQIPADETSEAQFLLLQDTASANGFNHYEISNFGKPHHYALHNTNYWKGIPYLGIGPGAHSFEPGMRKWNIGNNPNYIKAIEKGDLPIETETLSVNNQYNEYIMTGLRTEWGVNIDEIQQRFGESYVASLHKQLQSHVDAGRVLFHHPNYTLSKEGKFLADGICSDAFIL
jgi:oxygen-independent coproporphyrinogen-3 oxidase